MTADLSRDTAVRAAGDRPGAYAADLPGAWSYELPSGGVLMTVALRAMQAELAAPSFRPISATAIFCAAIPAGPLLIDVTVLRRGNAASQLRAALRSAAEQGPGLEVSATFGLERPGPDLLDAAPPAVPPPAEARVFEERVRGDGRARRPFFQNFDWRLGFGHPPADPAWTAGPARYGRWIRYLTPQALPDGTLDPLALPPIADTMPPALVQKLGPDAPPFHAPSFDLTVHFLDPVPSGWLLVNAYARRARAGYATAEAEIWGEDGRLAAYATQTMMIRARRR